MRARLARLLLAWATSLAGGCPCPACVRTRTLEATIRRAGGSLPRARRRQLARGSWAHLRRGGGPMP